MSVLPIGFGSADEGGYQIERSLRFDSSASAYLNRTPASAGNRKTWTWSGWVKRSRLAGTTQILFTASNGSDDVYELRYISDGGASGVVDSLQFVTPNGDLRTTAVHRDPSAWGHVVLSVDTTQATQSNRANLYFNGVLLTPSTTVGLLLNEDTSVNNTVLHSIGRRGFNGTLYFDGYLTEINFIDGSALDPTSFGEYNEDTGVWQPKAYTGSYGTNGFYLNFSDNASTTTLGDDLSGNGNDWTTNNFSVTAGAGNDSLVDTPTPYGTDTGVGGEVRGNYATWNPLGTQIVVYTVSVTNGNLDASYNAATNVARINGTLGLSSGKWYFEFQATAGSPMIGVATTDGANAYVYDGNVANKRNYAPITSGSPTSAAYGATWDTTNIIGVALDLDAGTLVFYKDNVSQGTAYSSLSGTFTPTFGYQGGTTVSGTANFGQRPFAYTAPSGFKALCTQNLPEPTIVDGGEYFNTVLYTGNNTTNAISGVGFQPDFTWIKMRSTSGQHALYDAVRGVRKTLSSSLTSAENTEPVGYSLESFDTDGFTLGADNTGFGSTNNSGQTFAAWNWKANGAGVSNTAGTITSTVSANTDSGFSIVTYTGTGANATVGHGLGVAPKLIIVKSRSIVDGWLVYSSELGATQYLVLSATSAAATLTAAWNNTAPTSTVFSIGTNSAVNQSSATYVAYCFAAIPGYSAFGSYTGNGSADGPMIFTNMRPRWVLIKRSSATEDWAVFDTARNTYNLTNLLLSPNISDAEVAAVNNVVDVLSNGFKMRGTGNTVNASGSTYIYMALASNPFKYSLAR